MGSAFLFGRREVRLDYRGWRRIMWRPFDFRAGWRRVVGDGGMMELFGISSLILVELLG